jgi:hypothetical protein
VSLQPNTLGISAFRRSLPHAALVRSTRALWGKQNSVQAGICSNHDLLLGKSPLVRVWKPLRLTHRFSVAARELHGRAPYGEKIGIGCAQRIGQHRRRPRQRGEQIGATHINPSAQMTDSKVFLRKSAIISSCGGYRYELRRIWNEALPPYVSGMLNPSTADAENDDPTIIRNWRRACALGYGSLIVWNLGAGRASTPRKWKEMVDPVGPENDAHIRRILIECRDRQGIAVVGWGAHGSFMGRDETVSWIAGEIGITLSCLGTTKGGQPKHPLYVRRDQSLIEWKGIPAADLE